MPILRLIRSFRRNPGTTAAAIVLAATGIGLFTIALTVADGALWRPLPFPNASQVVVLSSTHTSPRNVRVAVPWSFPRLQYVRERLTTVDLVSSHTSAALTYIGKDEPLEISGEVVSPQYFAALGATPARGRGFALDEDLPHAPQLVAVVSEAFLTRRRLAGDAIDIGSTIRLNGQLVSVIGVMPAEFRGIGGRADLWIPRVLVPRLTYPEYLTTNQDFITLVGRRRPDRSLAQVTEEIGRLASDAYREIPSDDVSPDVSVTGVAQSLGSARVRPATARAARLLLGAFGVLHALAMANLVALVLGGAVSRRREHAVALAIGATPGRLWRAQALEGVLLVVIGGVASLLALFSAGLAFPVLDPLASLGRGFLGTFSEVHAGPRMIAWWAAVTGGTAVVVSAIPASLVAMHSDVRHVREGAHSAAQTGLSWRRPGAGALILAVEAALAVLLIVFAGQLFASYRHMLAVNVGVEPDRVLTFELRPPETAVPPTRAVGFIDQVLDAIRTVPGVQSASVDGGAPLAGSASAELHIVGRPDDPRTGAPVVLRHYVGPEHFATLGVPVRAGRSFTPGDVASSPRVVVISRSAAQQFFPSGDAIGQRVWFEGSTLTSPDSSGEIVGVVEDVKYDPLLDERTTASFYTPYAQFTYGWRVYFVRTSADPWLLRDAVAAAVHRVAPDLPLLNVRPLRQSLTNARSAPRQAAFLFSGLAALGMVLAALGVWAVVSHAIAQRERDMAIRLALGSTPGGVLRLMAREGMRFPVAGLLVGCVLSLGASGLLRALLYQVAPGDPRIVLMGAVLFAGAALVACLGPAMRASRATPMATLRSD